MGASSTLFQTHVHYCHSVMTSKSLAESLQYR